MYLKLYEDVFVWRNEREYFIYNSKNYKSFLCDSTPCLEIIYNRIADFNNLYFILIEEDLLDVSVKNWIDNIIKIDAGCVGESLDSFDSPVSFPPLLRIQTDIERIKWMYSQGYTGEMLKYLHDITIHINGSLNGNLYYARQMEYPIKTADFISIDVVDNLLLYVSKSVTKNICIIGNIFSYYAFDRLFKTIKIYDINVSICILFSDFIEAENAMNILNNINLKVVLIIDDIIGFRECICDYSNMDIQFVFPILKKDDISEVFDVIDLKKCNDYLLKPLYNGDNMSFFKNNVYLRKDDILNFKLNKREVYLHYVVNTNFFGKLIYMPDNKVYSNLNYSHIGENSELVTELIYREIVNGKSWRFIRDNGDCSNCLYKYLCPSPSNYELIFNKMNLCCTI